MDLKEETERVQGDFHKPRSWYSSRKDNKNVSMGDAVVKGAVLYSAHPTPISVSVPPETLGSRPGSVVTGRDQEVRGATHNWPSVVRVRDILVSSRTSDSCGGPGAVCANQGCQVHGVSSDTLVWLASGLDARCVKKQLVGYRRTHYFQPSSLPSPYGSCSDETR